jgi:protein arginine N-methyltransferase 1
LRPLKPGHNEYSLSGYGDMIADTVRMTAYRRALAATIKPGAIVLDIGAGTGIMSLIACRLGAGKVYAIEPSDAIAVGQELAEANGCADRIEFLQASTFDVTLPQRADVMVSDLRGVLPLHRRHIASIADARRRLLAPSGTLIPQRDTVRAQLVGDAALHERIVGAWRPAAFDLDLSAGRRWAVNQRRKADFSNALLLGAPRDLFALDYRTAEHERASGEAEWRVEQDATVHGLAAWFDTVLAEGVELSNAPDQPRAIYGQMFFPLPEPVALARNDVVRIRLAATLVDDDYIWQWQASVRDAAGAERHRFRQSSFEGAPVNPARLDRRAGDFAPALGREGRAAALALALMDQRRSIHAIALELTAQFPDLYAAHPERARELVGDLSEWFADPS